MASDVANLLVVGGELALRDAVAASLRFLGFGVTVTDNGTDALRLARERPFDLVVLDIMLPDIGGFEVVRRLRNDGNLVPAVFLTAKDGHEDKHSGLTIGGDDYMTKPFGLEELAARVRTVLRRTRPSAAGPVLSFADLTLDQDSYEVRRAGRRIELSPTEFRLLRFLMLHPGRVLTRAQLLDYVWDYDFGGSSTVVSTYVACLRRKLASTGPDLIHTQRAVGYGLGESPPPVQDESADQPLRDRRMSPRTGPGAAPGSANHSLPATSANTGTGSPTANRNSREARPLA